MEISYSDTPADTAGQKLSHLLEHYADHPILLLLSGGSALALLDWVDPATLGAHVTMTTLDERFSTDPTVNNFAQIKELPFFEQALQRGVAVIDTTIAASDTLAAAGQRFAAALQQWRHEHPNGVVVATVGVGADGHTAGILPGDHGVDFAGEEWVVAYRVPAAVNPYTERVTVTYTFLREQVASAIVYAAGEKKRSALKQLCDPDCTVTDQPACIVHDLPDVTLVTDQSLRG